MIYYICFIQANERSSSPSEAIPTFLPFPGTEPPAKTSRKENSKSFILWTKFNEYMYTVKSMPLQ